MVRPIICVLILCTLIVVFGCIKDTEQPVAPQPKSDEFIAPGATSYTWVCPTNGHFYIAQTNYTPGDVIELSNDTETYRISSKNNPVNNWFENVVIKGTDDDRSVVNLDSLFLDWYSKSLYSEDSHFEHIEFETTGDNVVTIVDMNYTMGGTEGSLVDCRFNATGQNSPYSVTCRGSITIDDVSKVAGDGVHVYLTDGTVHWYESPFADYNTSWPFDECCWLEPWSGGVLDLHSWLFDGKRYSFDDIGNFSNRDAAHSYDPIREHDYAYVQFSLDLGENNDNFDVVNVWIKYGNSNCNQNMILACWNEDTQKWNAKFCVTGWGRDFYWKPVAYLCSEVAKSGSCDVKYIRPGWGLPLDPIWYGCN